MPTGTLIASTVCWESRPGQWSLTACLKATYTLAPGDEPVLAPQQDGSHEDVFFEQNPHGSLYSPTDFVPFKLRADVLLVGSANVSDTPVVRLRVGPLTKALRVAAGRAAGVTRVPLRYEHAPRKGENLGGQVDAARSSIDVEPPAETPGFGPLAPLWRAHGNPRAMETLAWSQRLRVGPAPGPAPAALDPLVLNAAPRDQQLQEILPGTPILLENLCPRFPRLETRVPSIVPRAFHVDPETGQAREILTRIDTLWIDTDRECFVVSWRGAVAVPGPSAAAGRIVTAALPPGASATFEEIDALARGTAPGPRATSRRVPAATAMMPEIQAPSAAPFPLAAPSAARADAAAKPIAGAPWAATPAAPVPRPGKHLESTLPLGASLPLPVTPAQEGGARPRIAPGTVMLDRAPLPAAHAPFPLAPAAHPAGPSESLPIAGAPWASVPAAPVPRPDKHLEGTMPLGASLAAVIADITARPRAPEAAPPPLPPPAAEVPAPPPARETPVPPAPSPAAKPAEALWRVDAPEPAAAPPAAPAAPPAPDVKKQVYGDFTRKKR